MVSIQYFSHGMQMLNHLSYILKLNHLSYILKILTSQNPKHLVINNSENKKITLFIMS